MKYNPFLHSDSQVISLRGHHWNVARLIHLSKDLPVMDIPLEHLNTYSWYKEMSLRQLVGHMKSVNTADLQYPIIMDEDGEILDGRHRIMKALLNGDETIKAVRFEENPESCKHDDEVPG